MDMDRDMGYDSPRDRPYKEDQIRGLRHRKRSLKKVIRDTRRLLAREDLPEIVRETKTRVLDMLVEEEETRQEELQIRKMAKKYRMIRFFEKRKVMRRISHLLSQFETDKNGVLQQIQQLRGDLNYIVHYPLTEKYYSLFPTTPSNNTTLQNREDMYQKISTEVKDGILEDAISSLCKGTAFDELPPIDNTLLPVNTDPVRDSVDPEKEFEEFKEIETEKEKNESRKKWQEKQAALQVDGGQESANRRPKKPKRKYTKKKKNPDPQEAASADACDRDEAPQVAIDKSPASKPKKPSKGKKKNPPLTAPASKRRKVAACDQEGAPQVLIDKSSFFI